MFNNQYNNSSSIFTPNQNNQSLTRRKRIVITIDKPNKKNKSTTYDSDSLFNPSKQLPKLLDISQRCFLYYQRFKQDRLEQEQFTQDVFDQLLSYLDRSFTDLLETIKTKQNQLKNCIIQKRKQFQNFHPSHFLSLTEKIQLIKQNKSYLQKQNFQSNSVFPINFNSQGQLKQNQVTQFAKVLNNFYNEIQSIQRINFKQNVKESVNFLRNLLEDQCSAFINKKICEEPSSTPQQNISFNNEQLFSIKQFNEETTQFSWEEFRANIDRLQKDRQIKIQEYTHRMKNF